MTELAQLEAEANAAIAGAPVDETAAAPGQEPLAPPPDPVENWRPYMGAATQLLSGLLLPQWDLTDVEKHELTESLAQILALHFPDGLDGKYAGYFRLLAISSIIVATRMAANGGKLPPLGPKRVEKPNTEESPALEAAPAAPV